ncbi:MAG: hypothetical protein NT154_05865, partial [Verrucomicrobia bacterium]|nr:hypothetical protein [Verrucomicrobiota bacterium]
MKLIRSFAAAFSLTALIASSQAASVGPAGYTNDFSNQSPATDWSYLTVPGNAGDVVSVAGLDAAVQAVAAANIDAPWPNGRTLYLLWA